MTHIRFLSAVGALIVLGALAAPARAAEAAPDPATQREFGAKLQVCGACHGANGNPRNANIPVIWGQQENYLSKQLQDFHSKSRKVEVMTWMAESLSPAELAPTAAFFAKKSWPARAKNAAAVTAPRGVAVCQSCHQQDLLGALQAEGTTTPRLAGQSYEYLVEEMRRFAEGERSNNADMVQIMKAISPADRDAMAHYISGL